MPSTPSQQQIADMLPDLRYEIDQIFVVPDHDENDWRIRESIFLAMLVHARLLLDFFEHTSRERDDVLCADFNFPSAPVPLSSKDRLRLNKDIAHSHIPGSGIPRRRRLGRGRIFYTLSESER